MAKRTFYDQIITFHKNNSPIRHRLQNGLGHFWFNLKLCMDTIPFLEHDCLWTLLPTMSDCNLVRVLITNHYTVSGWTRLQGKIRHLPKVQQVLCHKLYELWQGLLLDSCRVWRSLFEILRKSNYFGFFYPCEHLILLENSPDN